MGSAGTWRIVVHSGHVRPPVCRIGFTLNGQRYRLTRDIVETRLADVVPDTIHKPAVRINDTWFPVIQAFEIVRSIPAPTKRSPRLC